MAIFIPAYGMITALDVSQIFINHIYSKHGLPASIVSDRGSLFVSLFWTQLCQKLKISRYLSPAFHPEADGQTERVNQILEQYNWIKLINKKNTFSTLYGRDPSFDSIHISQGSPSVKLSTKFQSVQKVVKEELESEIRRFKKYAYRNRMIPPDFQPGDKGWLASKNIKTTRPTKKLSERWLGPFEVLKLEAMHTTSNFLCNGSQFTLYSMCHFEPLRSDHIPKKVTRDISNNYTFKDNYLKNYKTAINRHKTWFNLRSN
ncbi:hypothetical protein O181_048282 [Austropuccinia psidii MF-1]|uniref:Integrase catalytic domain-containing protein n=1 Tax=Austropuccinia psidii MF-1 TaxID=1389203 RepID=A0A9Q3DUT5_9BASI|nr:hypothetical protein [Austropuccinia psidii MF-1]